MLVEPIMPQSDAQRTRAAREPWSRTEGELAHSLGVDPEVGLSSAEARARLALHGPNRLRELRAVPAWRLLARQFASWIVAILGAAALLSFAFGEWLDGVAIALVLTLNAGIGFFTELRAVRSMEALRRLGSVDARVRRDGGELLITAADLVAGDVLLLDAGDVVTADLRLLEASKLEADESALTGESLPVSKSVESVAPDAALAERGSMLFKGTAITRGSGVGLVVATGMQTELGRIARLVQEATKDQTPLEGQLASLGRWLIWGTLAVAGLTVAAGIAAGQETLLMIETGVALAVAAIPEGLPVVATIALARGMWRMARRAALVNRLAAVETLGATTVIFTDKTGTLTENRMEVQRLVVGSELLEVEAAGLEPPGGAPDCRVIAAAVEVGVLCNNASLAAELDDAGDLGDPTELALLRLGARCGVQREELLARCPEEAEVAFDADTRMMATLHASDDGLRVAVKGAAEAVLACCTHLLELDGARVTLAPADLRRWAACCERLAQDGLRVLALAQKQAPTTEVDPYRELTLVGLVGLADPPREEVRGALAACRDAGIDVVMVTGDHAGTAVAIARAVGLVDGAEVPVCVGSELTPDRGPSDVRVFARVSPEQKLDLIAAYQRRGNVVAMTGDGVNDAPALRKADIGVAMGLRGTQVAREAADMVLVDDAFQSIVAAIEQGRVIFDNIRKFVLYLLSCNVSEVLVVALATLLGGPLPLLPLQILFLNLVTDVFPALALAFGGGDPAVLRRPPRDPDEPIVTGRGWLGIGGYALLLAGCVLGAAGLARSWLGYADEQALTISFMTLAFAQLWHVFNMRARGPNILRNEVTRNPWVWGALGLCSTLLLAAVYIPILSDVLETRPPDGAGWGLILVASMTPLIVGQAILAFRGVNR